jgi:hypothetical protein
MDQLVSDLDGVGVYLDDIIVSGATSEDHIRNLRKLLQLLDEKGLCCKREKCSFAESVIEYLGYTLSHQGVSKSCSVEAVMNKPEPKMYQMCGHF